jgi:hypothetical protein
MFIHKAQKFKFHPRALCKFLIWNEKNCKIPQTSSLNFIREFFKLEVCKRKSLNFVMSNRRVEKVRSV